MRPATFAATAASSPSMRPLTEMTSRGVFGPRRKNHQVREPVMSRMAVTARMSFFEWLLVCDIAPFPLGNRRGTGSGNDRVDSCGAFTGAPGRYRSRYRAGGSATATLLLASVVERARCNSLTALL